MRTTWLVLLAPMLATGCKSAQCNAWERHRAACLLEAEEAGIHTSGVAIQGEDCETYDSIVYADPILGPVLRETVPDFACLTAVWKEADCLSDGGLQEAVIHESACF